MGVEMKKNIPFKHLDIEKALKLWFLEHKNAKDDTLRHNKIYRLLRREIGLMGHWKAKDRGVHDIRFTSTTQNPNSFTYDVNAGLSNKSIKGMNKHNRPIEYPL